MPDYFQSKVEQGRQTIGKVPGPIPCPVCGEGMIIYRPTLGSMRRCSKCDTQLGIYDVQTYFSLRVMPDQHPGHKRYRNVKKGKLTKAETQERAREMGRRLRAERGEPE